MVKPNAKTKPKVRAGKKNNNNAEAADKVTETALLSFGFHIQAGCDAQGMRTIFGGAGEIDIRLGGGGISLARKSSKARARARFDFCLSPAGSVLLVPRAPRPAGGRATVRYLTVGSHHAAGIVRWRLCVRRGL